jgi:ferredoxin
LTDAGENARSSTVFRVILEMPEGLHTIECRGDEYIWNAAARSGVQLPAICRQGRCLTCAGKLISGAVDQNDADSYFPADEAAGFVLPCRAKPLSDLRIWTHQEWEMRRHRVAHGLPAPYS